MGNLPRVREAESAQKAALQREELERMADVSEESKKAAKARVSELEGAKTEIESEGPGPGGVRGGGGEWRVGGAEAQGRSAPPRKRLPAGERGPPRREDPSRAPRPHRGTQHASRSGGCSRRRGRGAVATSRCRHTPRAGGAAKTSFGSGTRVGESSSGARAKRRGEAFWRGPGEK